MASVDRHSSTHREHLSVYFYKKTMQIKTLEYLQDIAFRKAEKRYVARCSWADALVIITRGNFTFSTHFRLNNVYQISDHVYKKHKTMNLFNRSLHQTTYPHFLTVLGGVFYTVLKFKIRFPISSRR